MSKVKTLPEGARRFSLLIAGNTTQKGRYRMTREKMERSLEIISTISVISTVFIDENEEKVLAQEQNAARYRSEKYVIG